jgi:hypothetical protein
LPVCAMATVIVTRGPCGSLIRTMFKPDTEQN